jgi:hypothetical protein
MLSLICCQLTGLNCSFCQNRATRFENTKSSPFLRFL